MTSPRTRPAEVDRPAPAVTGRRIAGAAALISVITVVSRIVGFGRTLVLGRVAGAGAPVTEAYLTANTIPNIVFEVVAGGALAALVVPLIAGPIARGDRAEVGRTTSALLTWVLGVLVPLGGVVAIFARPIVGALISGDSAPGTVEAGTRMLWIFAPQIPLYGIGIVVGGVLQAHRRFAWPVLAPLLSSVVVIATYVLYGLVAPAATKTGDGPLPDVGDQLVLAVGTTLGVVALSTCLLFPLRTLGLRLRPTFRFDADARAAVGGLALVGVATVAAQQLALLYALYLANQGEPKAGSVYAFSLAQAVYLVPWSVLAVPLATSVYPELATAFSTGDEGRYRHALAGATRTTLLLCALGAAGMVALAAPAAGLFVSATGRGGGGVELAPVLVAYAPGLLGYGLFALHSRALYARRENRYAAVATVTGWGAVIVASGVLAAVLPRHYRVVAIALANSIGMTVLAVVIAVLVGRRAGRAGLHGAAHATVAAVVAGTAGAAAGWAVSRGLPADPGVGDDVLWGMLAGFAALIVFAAVAAVIDRNDVRPLFRRLLRIVGIAKTGALTSDNAVSGDNRETNGSAEGDTR